MTGERQPIEVLIRDLTTTSDKIRKLARFGYTRTEISKALGIRYQHVRKVLVDAGITEGLQRPNDAPESPIPVDTTSSRETPSNVLLQAGFQQVGEWTQTDGGGIAT